jgi:hypothetical protein
VDKPSTDVGLLFSVPLIFGLEPNNYCMYTKPVGEIIKWHNIKYLCCADDAQVCITSNSYDRWYGMLSSIEGCIEDISL